MNPPLTIDTDIEEIIENFSFLDEWEDRYGYLIELGKALSPIPESQMNDENKVQGCVSQVWLIHDLGKIDGNMVVSFQGASDAHIVRGLVAVALSIFSNKTPGEILTIDEQETFSAIGLQDHLTPQRANGLKSMVQRIKAIADHAARQGEQVAAEH